MSVDGYEKGTAIAGDYCPDCGTPRIWRATKNRKTLMAICNGTIKEGDFAGLKCNRKDHMGGPASLMLMRRYAAQGEQPINLTAKEVERDSDEIETGSGTEVEPADTGADTGSGGGGGKPQHWLFGS